ncbi:hypothetical protein CAP35_01650 [Chitinophagaceae bacterium IBVUCB1]|nr:hypothetical protein CAP35_01650 [Chitinophagaceae bacterium IBVUCB1]
MKKYLYILTAVLIGFTSCKDDFQIAAPYKDIVVAYGMLNAADTAHYIRVQKAFLDNNKSAIDLALIADSSYFDSLSVSMHEYNDNNTLRRSVAMMKVNMAAEGYPKDAAGSQGFFQNPSYAYKLKIDSLNPYYKYRLIIKNNKSGATDSSEYIMVVNGARSKNAQNFYIDDFTKGNYAINFAKTQFQASYTLFGTTPRNAKMIEGILRFHIVEVDVSTGRRTRKSADFTFAKDVKNSSDQFSLKTVNTAFYGFLYDAFGPAPANTQRFLDSCDMFVYAGSNELYSYFSLAQVQNASLLGDQIKPTYSNMAGADAYGIVASRALATYKNVIIDDVTLDSIKLNPITKDMLFIGRTTD